MKKWVTPLIILVVLLLLMVFRYDTERVWGDMAARKWQVDRWTGITWHTNYGIYGFTKRIGVPDYISDTTGYIIHHTTTGLWYLLLAGTVVFLAKGIREEVE